MTALAVFVLMTVLDYVWAYYTRAIQAHAELSAASWAVAIILLNGMVQIGYVNDPWLLLPAGAGAFLGTYLAVRFHRV